jgi:hypothetical protein
LYQKEDGNWYCYILLQKQVIKIYWEACLSSYVKEHTFETEISKFKSRAPLPMPLSQFLFGLKFHV